LSLCKSPLKTAQESVAVNAHLLLDVEKNLSVVIPDWKLFIQAQSDHPLSTEELRDLFNVSPDQIRIAEPPESARKEVEQATSNPEKLLELYKSLVLEQKRFQREYMQEDASNAQEDQQAAERKQDHTPVVYMAVKALAEAGVLKDIVRDLRGD
jgi:ubiquitin carboxyl-terminal hydrolase L5